MLLAQEIIVDHASYPTERIAKNSHDYRPLGLGYANLGALLMARGLPYDSEPRAAHYAGAITALMTRAGVRHERANLPSAWAPSPATRRTASRCWSVIREHREAAYKLSTERRRAAGARTRRAGLWDEARGPWPRARLSATRRSRCWRPPAPSAS